MTMKRVASIALTVVSLCVIAPLALHAGIGVASTAPSTTMSTSTPVSASQEQAGEPIELGLAPVALVGPAVSGAGDRPEFSWEPVAGAVTYSLAVITVADEPLWAWEGGATAVILGGWPVAPISAAPGPLLVDDAKWFVVAFDAQGVPIANSVMRPVAP